MRTDDPAEDGNDCRDGGTEFHALFEAVLCMFHFAGTQTLTDEGRQCAADCVDRDVEQVGDTAAQTVSGHGDGTVVDDCFVHQNEAKGGKELTDGSRDGDSHDLLEGFQGQRIFAEGDGRHTVKTVFIQAIDNVWNQQEFGERCCQCGTENAQIHSENENRVQDDVQHSGRGVDKDTALTVAVGLMNGMEQGQQEHTDEVEGNTFHVSAAVCKDVFRTVKPGKDRVGEEKHSRSHHKSGKGRKDQQMSRGLIGFFTVSGADGLGNQSQRCGVQTGGEGHRTGSDRSDQSNSAYLQFTDAANKEGINHRVQGVDQVQQHQRQSHLNHIFLDIFIQ